MLKRSLLSVLVLLACVVVLLVVAYQFRVAVLRSAANAFLDSNTAVLADLQGVEFDTRSATVAELEVLLPASGLRVVVRDIALDYSLRELLLAGKADRLAVASIALTRQQAVANQPEPTSSGTTLSDLLLLLRDFPVNSLDVSDIRIPDREDALVVSLQRQGGTFSFSVVSGALQLLATAQLPQTAATAEPPQAATRLQLLLSTGGTTVADFSLDLQPAASGYRLSGSGRADIPDFAALLGESLLDLLGLPLASLQLQLALDAEISDAFLAAPPALFSLQIQGGSTLVLRDGLVGGLERLTLRIEETSLLKLAAGNAAASERLPLLITGSWQQQAFDATFVVGSAECRLQAGAACTLDFDGSANVAALAVGGTPAPGSTAPADATVVNALSFAGGGTLALDRDSLLVTLNPGAQVASGRVTSPTLQLAGLTFTATAPLLIGRTLDAAGVLTLEGQQIAGTLTQLVASGYTIDTAFSLRDIRVTSADVLAGEAVLQTQGLQASGGFWLPAMDIDARLQLQASTLAFATPLLLRSAPADPGISVQGSYALDSGNAVATLELPALQLEGPGASLSSYLGGWPFPFDVMTGTLGAQLDVEWHAADTDTTGAPPTKATTGILTGSLTATLSDAAGYYGEMFFAGLDTGLDGSIDTSAALPLSTSPLSLTIATLDVGVPLTAIAVNYQVDGAAQTVTVDSFHAALLGGTLSGEGVSYNFASERNFLNLRFTNLRLDHMLELVEYDGIAVSGAVSGMLPLAITPNGVEVEEGRLFAEAPGGSIRYLDGPTAGGGGNLGVDLVNQALGNYQFDSLESSIEYSPEGELLLGMQLQGYNPDMNNGQRINLNLNLSNNIPDLLESLQAGRAIEDFLEGQYRPQPAAEPAP